MLPGKDGISCPATGTCSWAAMLSRFPAEFTDVCFLGDSVSDFKLHFQNEPESHPLLLGMYTLT